MIKPATSESLLVRQKQLLIALSWCAFWVLWFLLTEVSWAGVAEQNAVVSLCWQPVRFWHWWFDSVKISVMMLIILIATSLIWAKWHGVPLSLWSPWFSKCFNFRDPLKWRSPWDPCFLIGLSVSYPWSCLQAQRMIEPATFESLQSGTTTCW